MTRKTKQRSPQRGNFISWLWNNRGTRRVQIGCGSLLLLCIGCAVFGWIGQTLGFIPDATERAQTRTATAAILAAAQTSTQSVRDATETTIALSATLTPSNTPTFTPSVTFTFTPTFTVTATFTMTAIDAPSLFVTNTPSGLILSAATATTRATNTTIVTSAPVVTMYTVRAANLRSCATSTNDSECPVVVQVSAGTELQVVGQVTGAAVDGDAVWHIVLYNGQQRYIHSSLVSETAPVVVSTPAQSQQLISTPIPSNGLEFVCNGDDDLNCGSFSYDCSAAQRHLEICGTDEDDLDGNDRDGRACENGCP